MPDTQIPREVEDLCDLARKQNGVPVDVDLKRRIISYDSEKIFDTPYEEAVFQAFYRLERIGWKAEERETL